MLPKYGQSLIWWKAERKLLIYDSGMRAPQENPLSILRNLSRIQYISEYSTSGLASTYSNKRK